MVRSMMCLWLAWLGVALPLPIAAAEKDDSAEIDSLGARYSRNAEGAIVDVDLSNAWVTDADLGKLAGLTRSGEHQAGLHESDRPGS